MQVGLRCMGLFMREFLSEVRVDSVANQTKLRMPFGWIVASEVYIDPKSTITSVRLQASHLAVSLLLNRL